MNYLTPGEQLEKSGKTKSDFTNDVMEYLTMLYSDQIGTPCECTEITTDGFS